MPNHQLSISLDEDYAYLTGIWIFDARRKVIAEPSGMKGATWNRIYSLPTGNYIIRTVLNGQIEDTEIALNSDLLCFVGSDAARPGEQKLAVPKLFSSALIGGMDYQDTSFEYYTHPAEAISRISTVFTLVPGAQSLFIFLRYPNRESYQGRFEKKPYWERFSVEDAEGDVMARFPQGCFEDTSAAPFNIVPESGFIGFNAILTPGLYFLRYDGADARMMPAYIYKGCHTQFFMTVADEPLFGSIRIFISKQRAFDAFNPLNRYIDVCLDKLQNGDYNLDEKLLWQVASGKWDSPMLGLLGACIYLHSQETKEDNLFRVIVQNLQKNILADSKDSLDLWAVDLLSRRHFREPVQPGNAPLSGSTPMLRIAFDTIRRAAIEQPWIVPEGSLNDHISENQYFDSPYNTFRPFRKAQPDTSAEQATAEREDTDSISDAGPVTPGATGHVDFFDVQSGGFAQNQRSVSMPGGFGSDLGSGLAGGLKNFKAGRGLMRITKPGAGNTSRPMSAGFWMNRLKQYFSPVSLPVAAAQPDEANNWVSNAVTQILEENGAKTNEDIARQLGLPVNTISRVRKATGR